MSPAKNSIPQLILLLWLVPLFAQAAAKSDSAPSSTPNSQWLINDWVFRLPVRPPIPEVKQKNWPRSPLDHFILAKLEEKGIPPSPPAEKAILLRRATFDLHGLPPTLLELEAFLADRSTNAFARVVARLLASPHYGERWGRHWLDVARFAESQGFEYDKIRENAWRYRDYVVQSFNADKPYFQFIKEQIAGDALQPLSRDGIIATGFLVAGPYDEAGNTSASTLLKARIREEELEDMIAAAGQTFLGLTINCARCHDHKFDPILQKDYYRVKAAFDGVRHGERSLLTAEEVKIRESHQAQLRTRIGELERAVGAIEQAARVRILAVVSQQDASRGASWSAQAPSPMARWTFQTDARDSIGHLNGTLEGGASIANGRLHLNGKGAFVRTEPLPRELKEKTLEAWVALRTLAQSGGGVMAVESKDGGVFDAIVFGEREPQKWIAGSSFLNRTRDLAAPAENASSNQLVHLAIVYNTDSSIAFYRNGTPYGEAYKPSGENATLQTYPGNGARVLFGLRHTGAGNGFLEGEIEEAQLYDRALSAEEIAASARAHGAHVITHGQVQNALTPEDRQQRATLLADLESQRATLNEMSETPQTYAANSRQPEATFVLARGDVEKKKEPIIAGGLSAISSLPQDFGLRADAPEQERRLKLADWIGNAANPLTARVFVNRVWYYHFGRGIVGTPNDFGLNGERPSHPELLDFLATEFITQGQSIKNLHRLIMLSSAYQQSAEIRRSPSNSQAKKDKQKSPDEQVSPLQIDAEDHFLWHFPLRRLEGEAVRDAMLSVSGQLNPKVGGPSYRPFTVFVSNSHFYNLTDPSGPEYNRRTLYRMTVHSGRDPLLDSLDCPDPSTKTPVRGVTTTPIQSMGLMNDPFIQRQAKSFAERLKREAGASTTAQITLAWRLAFARLPRKEEGGRALALARQHGMESVCWALLNASEFLYVR